MSRNCRQVLRAIIAFSLLIAAATLSGQEIAISIGDGEPLFSSIPPVTLAGKSSATAGSAVRVTIGDETHQTIVREDGTWSLDWPTPLAGGTYLVNVTVTDPQGRTAAATEDLRVALEGRMPRQPLFQDQREAPRPPIITTIDEEVQAFVDRWQIIPPAEYELQVTPRGKWDPYNQNILKADKPMFGQDIFLSLTGISDTLFEARELPTPSGVSPDDPGGNTFFGDGDQVVGNQNIVVSADLYKGLTTFKPATWRARATIIANVNYVNIKETAGVNPDVRQGSDRVDGQLGVQELFYERKIMDLSANYDFMSIRAGVQSFSSDFRGFIFNDQNLGVRFFGNYGSNRYQYNVAVFDRFEKDTNSGLNVFADRREQQVAVANFYHQDFLTKGLTATWSVHYLRDEPSVKYNENDVLVRPAPVGDFTPHEITATYVGMAALGKFNRINIDGAAYYVFGRDTKDPISGFDPIGGPVGGDGVQPGDMSSDISGWMAALELSKDYDWFRPKVSYFYASGDDDIFDRDSEGFDAIFSNVNFVGGGFSFWNRMGIPLTGTGLGLTQRGSLLADLQSSKDQGQPEFTNPGIHIASLGLDLDLTPRWKGIITGNYIRLDKTEVIEGLLFQGDIDREMGLDFSVGARYRPFFTNNVTVLGGAAIFVPGSGFEDIYEDDNPLFQFFTNLILQF